MKTNKLFNVIRFLILISFCSVFSISSYAQTLAVAKSAGKWLIIDQTGKTIATVDIQAEKVDEFTEDGIAVFKSGAKSGYINSQGTVIVPAEYDKADNFSHGIARVKKVDKWGLIDKMGKIILPIEYQDIKNAYSGMIAVKQNNLWGYIDQTGKIIISPKYQDCKGFENTIARVKKDMKWGCIDKTEKTIIPFEYDIINGFRNNAAIVKKGAKYGIIDFKGTVILPIEYENIKPLADEKSVNDEATQENSKGDFTKYQVKKVDKWGLVDNNGKILVPIEHVNFTVMNNCVIRIKQNEKWGAIDFTGKIVIPFEYRELKPILLSISIQGDNFFNGAINAWNDKFLVKKDALWGVIDAKNNMLLPMEYNDVKLFTFTELLVKKGAFWGAVDTKGKIVIPLMYTDARNFWENSLFGFATAQLFVDFNKSWPGVVKVKTTKWGCVDSTHKVIIPIEFDDIRELNSQLVKVKKLNKWGCMNKKGEVITQLEFDDIKDTSCGFTKVKMGLTWGFINAEGKVIISPQYDFVTDFTLIPIKK